jgi:DNA-binding NarL/FixJ family response regulator
MGESAHTARTAQGRDSTRMIRVAVVDDHHAVRLGLTAMLAGEPDMEPVGAATSVAETGSLLYRTAPDVVLLDYRLSDGDGLTLCQTIKRDVQAPAVILHSAFADETLVVAAILAGADGIVHKGAPGRELAEAIRAVAVGDTWIPPIDYTIVRAGGEVLDEEDLPILGMLVHGTPHDEVARTLNIPVPELRDRLRRMLDALRVPSPAQR